MVGRKIKVMMATVAATASTASGTALMVSGAPATRATTSSSSSICAGGWGAAGVFTHSTQKSEAASDGSGTSSAFAVSADSTIPTAFTPPSSAPDQQQQQSDQLSKEKPPKVSTTLGPHSDTAELFISSAALFPDSTEAERRRFLTARKGNVEEATAMLCEYLEFRQQFASYLTGASSAPPNEDQERLPQGAELVDGDVYFEALEVVVTPEGGTKELRDVADSKIPSNDKSRYGKTSARQDDGINNVRASSSYDEQLWYRAAKAAMLYNEEGAPDIAEGDGSFPYLPRIARFDYQDPMQPDQYGELLSLERQRIVQVLPGLLELDRASAQTYAVSLALYLDSQLDRDSLEKVTVVVDLRAGGGWPNPTPRSVLPFLRTVVKLLNDRFPERLAKCVVFPLPYAARVIWQLVKVFLDPTTASKISIISGSALVSSSPPTKSLLKHFNASTVNAMEQNRLSAFTTGSEATEDGREAES